MLKIEEEILFIVIMIRDMLQSVCVKNVYYYLV